MRHYSRACSLMLQLMTILILASLVSAKPHGRVDPTQALAGRNAVASTVTLPMNAINTDLFDAPAMPCTGDGCAIASPQKPLPCDSVNGTRLTHGRHRTNYTMICDIDFPAQNIYPFILASSFEECLNQCHYYNLRSSGDHQCAGFVFAPERINAADDCYLKSSLNEPASATIHLVGATVEPTVLVTASSAKATATSNIHAGVASRADLHVSEVNILGVSKNKPSTQYIDHPLVVPQKLAKDLLVPGIHPDLITDYPLAGDTGSWSIGSLPLNPDLADMKVVPHMSRDGGRGGTINGTRVFIFCDTANFAVNRISGASEMVGFVSSSAATDDGMNALRGQPLDLVDHIGGWQDDVGRMRGFAPMTTGEQSFNIDLSGDGYRYAVWPESSLIPLNASHSILYPALIYDVVDMKTQEFVLHSLGNSVLLVHIDETYGPVADRVAKQFFTQDEVSFGTVGGIRAWGPSGKGNNDGHVYLLGKIDNGVMVARAAAGGFADRSAFDYWNGDTWVKEIPAPESTALLLDIPIMCLDVFYVPATRRFMMVYLNALADNTFYYRTMTQDFAVDPPYETGDGKNPDPFYVENILTRDWSEGKVLVRLEAPPQGFVYAGGIHEGYFGDDDVTNGGMKMLLTWTEHTGKDAADPESGYAHKSAVVMLELI